MESETTVLSLKQSFIATQTRLLSQPLAPSRSWRNANDAAEDGLPEKAVDDALVRLNHTLQQHSRRVYAPQATRHVAEQIDRLYWNAGERAIARDGEADDAEGLSVGADYANLDTIASLPPTWESEREVTAKPMEARRYAELVGLLQSLAARKQEADARVARLRRMQGMLAPFQQPQGQEGPRGVQENLVTRGGEVEKELERMRMLLARVGDRVARMKDYQAEFERDKLVDPDSMAIDEVEVQERRKVDDLLDLFDRQA